MIRSFSFFILHSIITDSVGERIADSHRENRVVNLVVTVMHHQADYDFGFGLVLETAIVPCWWLLERSGCLGVETEN